MLNKISTTGMVIERGAAEKSNTYPEKERPDAIPFIICDVNTKKCGNTFLPCVAPSIPTVSTPPKAALFDAPAIKVHGIGTLIAAGPASYTAHHGFGHQAVLATDLLLHFGAVKITVT